MLGRSKLENVIQIVITLKYHITMVIWDKKPITIII